MFVKKNSDNVTNAEVLFSNFVSEHNLPFLVADHFSDLCKKMFPDSEISKKFSCKRTKTTHIVNQALGPHFDTQVTDMCKTEKFSIMVDESNDHGGEKSVAVLVRVYDSTIQRITTKFLGLPTCNIGTAENLFDSINSIFVARDIPWSNCIGYSSDNASVMIGNHNSVLSRVRDMNPSVYDLGCVCHLANLCVQAAVKSLPVSVEDLLIDVFYHFHHSAKRKEIYKEFQDFTDTEPLKIIKHCSTRWLSLEKCVVRFLQQWPALRSYFESHEECEKPGRVRPCRDALTDPVVWMYCSFLESILPLMSDFNTTFQSGIAMIAHLHTQMRRLLRKLLGKFVKAEVISSATDVTAVDYRSADNQLADDFLAVGLRTREYIADHDDISTQTLKDFYRNIRQFYQTIVEKMMKKFPFKDSVLLALGFLNPSTRSSVSAESVITVADRFLPNLPAEKLQDQTEEYFVTPEGELPSFDSKNLDQFWVDMRRRKLPDGQYQFDVLGDVAIACLSIAHSNADAERCFSVLRKIQTDSRHNLSEKTTHNLLSVKFNNNSECHMFQPDKQLLRSASVACSDYSKL